MNRVVHRTACEITSIGRFNHLKIFVEDGISMSNRASRSARAASISIWIWSSPIGSTANLAKRPRLDVIQQFDEVRNDRRDGLNSSSAHHQDDNCDR
jgi:hypothetical protein